MTTSQLKGMIKFHKKAYNAYKKCGKYTMAVCAKAKMIELYLQLRATR